LDLAVRTKINRPSTSVYNDDTFAALFNGKTEPYGTDGLTNIDGLRTKPIPNAKMQTSLAFSDEAKALVPSIRVGDQTGNNGGVTHLALLFTLPTIWMGHYELNIVLQRCPESFSMGLLDEFLCALKEISQEICQDTSCSLLMGQRWKFGPGDSGLQVQLKPEQIGWDSWSLLEAGRKIPLCMFPTVLFSLFYTCCKCCFSAFRSDDAI
jgi:hypothetical protein